VVRVIVDHDLITIPEPIIAEGVIGLGNTEEESAKPKTRWTASPKAEDMTPTDAARKSPMFERPVDMVPGIIAARVVADPLIVCVNVGSFWMSRFIRKTTALRRCGLLGSLRLLGAGRLLGVGRRRTVRRDVSAANTMHITATLLAAPFLCNSRDGNDREYYE
jgi:hypothetical protein